MGRAGGTGLALILLGSGGCCTSAQYRHWLLLRRSSSAARYGCFNSEVVGVDDRISSEPSDADRGLEPARARLLRAGHMTTSASLLRRCPLLPARALRRRHCSGWVGPAAAGRMDPALDRLGASPYRPVSNDAATRPDRGTLGTGCECAPAAQPRRQLPRPGTEKAFYEPGLRRRYVNNEAVTTDQNTKLRTAAGPAKPLAIARRC